MLLKPNVLECMLFIAKCTTKDCRRITNYEFDLYLDGNHKVCIDGVNYPNSERCLVFKKPGQVVSAVGDYNMYVLTLDFSHSIIDQNKIFRPKDGKLQPLCDFPELDDLPTVFCPYHFDELKVLMQKLSKCSYPNAVDLKAQEQYIKEFLLLALYDANKFNNYKNPPSTLNEHVRTACNFIAENFRKNITVKEIADRLHVTENHLIKLFKREINQTPMQYLLELKLVYARNLLMQSDHSVKEVSFMCGFNTPSYFSKRFFERFGVLPNQLKQNTASLQK